MIGLDSSVLVQLEVQEAPKHADAHALLKREALDPNETIALAPQVMLEFLHVVTDARRFPRPLTMDEALRRAQYGWQAREVTPIYPTAEANNRFLQWMTEHNLGRKRIIDTHLAATFWACGIRRVLTSNSADFQIFGVFDLLSP